MMLSNKQIGLYNPQLCDPSALELTLVMQTKWLSQTINKHKLSRHFTLVTGPSGSGKTHLSCLFAQAFNGNPEQTNGPRIVHLKLKPGDIANYLDLLLQILTQLNITLEPFYALTANQSIITAEQQIKLYSSQQRLILLSEDFDHHLAALSHSEQNRLKTFLNENSHLALFATATHGPRPDNPMMTLFEHCTIAPLNLQQAETLMRQIALLRGDQALANDYSLPNGRVCIQALHHLAQGLPRHYVHFALLAEKQRLTEFNHIIAQMLDHLSSGYHQVLLSLPPQQRKLFNYIARQQGATAVIEIARHNLITQQTTSGQLKKMRSAELVVATSVGRGSHYELASPMMRLALNLSQHNLHGVNQQINFLRHWFGCRQSGYLSQDGQSFCDDPQWLKLNYQPKAHHQPQDIAAFIEALNTQDISGFAVLRIQMEQSARHYYQTQDEHDQQEHIRSLYALIYTCLEQQQFDCARLFCEDLFSFVELVDTAKMWKRLCHMTIGLSALFAFFNRIDAITPFVSQLEKQETKFGSQQFSIALSHILIGKARGYVQAQDRGKTQQVLEQLRFRAEKRNSLEIAGAYCHAVKATIGFIAQADPKLAAKILRQVDDIAGKYQLNDLAFACASRFWAQAPEQVPMDRLVAAISQLNGLDGFDYEIFFLLLQLAMQPLSQQIIGYNAIWQALVTCQQQPVFAAALNHVSVTLARTAPKRYPLWYQGCSELLTEQPKLARCKHLLQAIDKYLQNDNDPHQLLVLPLETRMLVLQDL